MLKNPDISLRSLEREDLDFLFALENDRSIWKVSGTTECYTKEQIANYIENARQDILIAEQYRFIIDLKGTPIGCIDLYDYNWEKQIAGVGIVVCKSYRKRGYAKEALLQLIEYSWKFLRLEQLYSEVLPENKVSIALFLKVGFLQKGRNKFVLRR